MNCKETLEKLVQSIVFGVSAASVAEDILNKEGSSQDNLVSIAKARQIKRTYVVLLEPLIDNISEIIPEIEPDTVKSLKVLIEEYKKLMKQVEKEIELNPAVKDFKYKFDLSMSSGKR